MRRFGLVLFVLLVVTSSLYGQPSKPRPRHETWYELALRHINPDNTEYGSIWEQRKRAFLGQFGNRYFQYGFATTVATVLLLTVTFVQRMNYKRALDVAAQSIADVIRHDEYSRQVAREAIRRYNDHIEACNRVIEARHEGLSNSIAATESELYRIRQELADTREENKSLRNDLAKKPTIISSVKSEPTARQEQPVQGEMEFPAQYIERINALQKQLREEQRKNQQRKGTSVNDHRA